jgi:hypothetical protein
LIILEAYGGWSNRPVCGGGVSMFCRAQPSSPELMDRHR